MLRCLQAFGIWFQLIALAEQNATMRRLRPTEVERGPAEVPGTFAPVLCEAARAAFRPRRSRRSCVTPASGRS